MYLWKIDQLKKKLSTDGLTEKQLYYYILIYVAVNSIGVETIGFFPHESPTIWSYAGAIINISIAVFGTAMVFRANGGESGVQFAARYFSISLVAIIRFILFSIPLTAVLMLYLFASDGLASDIPVDAILDSVSAIWYTLFYAYIIKHIRQVATA